MGLFPAELLIERKLRSRLDLLKLILKDCVQRKQYISEQVANKNTYPRYYVVEDTGYAIRFAKDKNQWVSGFIVAYSIQKLYMSIIFEKRYNTNEDTGLTSPFVNPE